MTQDLDPTPRHGHPSSAEIDISKLRESHIALKERHAALKDNVGELGATMMEVKGLLLAHITNATERHAQLLATFNAHNLEDAVVHQRVLQIDVHQKATDQRLEDMGKRDPVSFWSSITAAVTAVGTVVYVIFGGRAP
jgi:hypothetical protein